MKSKVFSGIFLFLLKFIYSSETFSQTAPAHLKYFGYYYVDCLYDDPNDVAITTNYISEVDSFSNFDLLCVSDYTTDIVSRVNLMTAHCVKPLLSLYDVFYVYAGAGGPGGVNYDLYPNYQSRWNSFKTTNASVLNASQIAAFYIMDEPTWNGVTFSEYNTICSMVKSDFPNIPIFLTEAWPELDSLQIPVSVDWISFDRYGIFKPSTDPTYQGFLADIKSKKSTPNQKIFLVVDDQWFPYYANTGGYTPDSMVNVIRDYYNLAVSDPDIIGLMGFIWPGGITTGHLGVRNMPQSVIDLNVQIGKMIKANNSPCNTTGTGNIVQIDSQVGVYPNPAKNKISIIFSGNNEKKKLQVYNSLGALYMETELSGFAELNITSFPRGIYFVRIKSGDGYYSKKVIIQ
jgi:hypothetical protein